MAAFTFLVPCEGYWLQCKLTPYVHQVPQTVESARASTSDKDDDAPSPSALSHLFLHRITRARCHVRFHHRGYMDIRLDAEVCRRDIALRQVQLCSVAHHFFICSWFCRNWKLYSFVIAVIPLAQSHNWTNLTTAVAIRLNQLLPARAVLVCTVTDNGANFLKFALSLHSDLEIAEIDGQLTS